MTRPMNPPALPGTGGPRRCAYEEPSIAQCQFGRDYLLFDRPVSDHATFNHHDPARRGQKECFLEVPWETIYEETASKGR